MAINSNKEYSIGIDIGGTKIRSVLWNGQKVIADSELATPTDSLEHFLIMAKASLDPLLDRAAKDKVKVAGVGLGVAGVMDIDNRKMLHSPNLTMLDGANVGEELEKLLGLAVKMDNDARCFVRAEALAGAGRGYKSVYGLIVGTGIGGGWWHNGEIHKGAHGNTTEVDTLIIDLPSSLNLEQGYHKLTQNNPAKLAQEAFKADPLAERVFEELGRHLGVALANIANIIDPEIFVLGGGAMESSELFLPVVKATLKNHIASSEAAKKIKAVKAKLGRDAGAIGAALLIA